MFQVVACLFWGIRCSWKIW